MLRIPAFLIATTALVSPALAATDPAVVPGSTDTRIRTVDYSEATVTRIISTNMVPVNLVYGESEHVVFISGLKVVDVTPDPKKTSAKDKQNASDAADQSCTTWCATRHANEMTLQALQPDMNGSFLAVTTERPDPNPMGTVRNAKGEAVIRHHYAYELKTQLGQIEDGDNLKRPAILNDQAYFRVVYTYSAEDKAARVAAWNANHVAQIRAAQQAAQQKVAEDRLRTAQFGPWTNHKWNHNDSPDCAALSPRDVFDNGQFTTLVFPSNSPVSVPLKYNGPHDQSRLDWHPEKAPDSSDLVVIHSVPVRFVLQTEKQSCLFERDPSAPWPNIPFTGTSSPEVVRETRK